MITNRQFDFTQVWNDRMLELQFQRLLINRRKKSMTKPAMHCHCRTNDGVCLFVPFQVLVLNLRQSAQSAEKRF